MFLQSLISRLCNENQRLFQYLPYIFNNKANECNYLYFSDQTETRSRRISGIVLIHQFSLRAHLSNPRFASDVVPEGAWIHPNCSCTSIIFWWVDPFIKKIP